MRRAASHLLCFLILLLELRHCQGNGASPPATIQIGALVATHTTIGKLAAEAIRLAIRDVNSDHSLLNASVLSLQLYDTTCSVLPAAVAGMELLNQEVVAVVGPQSSGISYFIAHMASAAQVPLVSFGATDPSLSESQYPFFFRMTHNDATQMAVIADIIKHFMWREVLAIYSDDDYGKNGVSALNDALELFESGIILQKTSLDPQIDVSGIDKILIELLNMESKIFVVHMQQELGIRLLLKAFHHGMLNKGFVWIVTDLIAVALDTLFHNRVIVKSTQGVIGTRSYFPQSSQLQYFLSEWDDLAKKHIINSDQINSYALYAYDAVWVIARSLDRFITHGGTFHFHKSHSSIGKSSSDLVNLKKFEDGLSLRLEILKERFNGTTGHIQLDEKGDLMDSTFEIVNMVGRGMRSVGYWSKATKISPMPPNNSVEVKLAHEPPKKELLDIVWPGGSTQVPHGWAPSRKRSPLLIGLPRKAGYMEMLRENISTSNVTTFQGFCISVFESAITYLPYTVLYKFVPYGDGSDTPVYDDLINLLANKVFDAVIADVTITTQRLRLVEFTQPYTESGLVIVTPIKHVPSNLWAFLRPFTPAMWLTTGAFFLFTGAIIWVLEHKMNRAFRGSLNQQIVTSIWFIFSTLYFCQNKETKTTLGRIVLLVWLFAVLILNSSYIASLTSILTVQQLSPTISGIESLLKSDAPIGYQTGSFVKDYLLALKVDPQRLKPLNSKAMYTKGLQLGPEQGGVAAIIDELPYVQMFLASACDFCMAGQVFTKGGWGFAFPKGSPLTNDMSEAILTMSGNGELQKIHDFWFSQHQCETASNQVHSDMQDLKNFRGLFLVTGMVSTICIMLYFTGLLSNFRSMKAQRNLEYQSASASKISRAVMNLKSFIWYMDQPHPYLEARRTKRKLNRKGRSYKSKGSGLGLGGAALHDYG